MRSGGADAWQGVTAPRLGDGDAPTCTVVLCVAAAFIDAFNAHISGTLRIHLTINCGNDEGWGKLLEFYWPLDNELKITDIRQKMK